MLSVVISDYIDRKIQWNFAITVKLSMTIWKWSPVEFVIKRFATKHTCTISAM